MDETCIVCLGELATTSSPDATSTQHAASPAEAPTSPSLMPEKDDKADLIAHLLPCNHTLHNDCLRPWVERANSCPICRATFNMVELRSHLNGPTTSSYGVQDKKQTAEVDESLTIDESILEDGPSPPCIFCLESSDDDVLLLCDGCQNSCHTYCAGLDRVPAGAWFCQFCDSDSEQHTLDTRWRAPRSEGRQSRRGRQARSRGSQPDPGSLAWTQIWQSILHRTNIDLDFPYEEEDPTERARSAARQREFNDWQQRFRVAERQGGAARFRDTASSVLPTRIARTPTPRPESQEELRAWNAYEKANELQAEAVNSRKRGRSSTASPQEPQPAEPERQLKRPRHRRIQGVADQTPTPRSQPSTRPASSVPAPAPNREATRPEGPSFLQSLLKEVETASNVPNNSSRNPEKLTIAVPNRSDSSSPVSLSPNLSPVSSSRSSPRPRSQSPSRSTRPASPPLSSRIDPSWSQQRNFSPISPTIRQQSNTRNSSRSGGVRSTYEHATSRSNDTSPTRAMSLTDKEEVQALVKDNLRPLYREKRITSQQYTEINREISRQLYEQVSAGGGLKSEERDKWKDVAASQVDNAVKALSGAT